MNIVNNETLDVISKIKQDKVRYGLVDKVNTQKQTIRMSILHSPDSKPESIEFAINNPMTTHGAGLRVMPIAGKTIATVYEDSGGKFYHLGYYLDNVGDLTDDRLGDIQDRKPYVLLRHLSEGEVQLSGAFGNEIYLPTDGSVVLKSSLGSHLRLDNYMSRLDGGFANLKFEMDGVRLRMGNVIRPSETSTTDDQYTVKGNDGKVKGADKLSDGETYTQIREFTVQVGTLQDPDNKYRDYVADSPKDDISPTVATFSMSDVFVRENGKPLFTAKKPVKCFLRTGTGGGFMVGEDGSFYIMDYNNWSSVRFPTDGSRSLRLRKSYISVEDMDDESAEYKTEIKLLHESNASIEIREGYIQLQDKTGRSILINEYGTTINAPQAAVSIIAKDINLSADGGSVAIGGFPIDGVLKATFTSTLFDTHMHSGPMGPPLSAFQWTPYVQIPMSPLVAQGFKVT